LQNRETVVTIGNFDGVHLGHRRLFEKVKKRAGAEDMEGVALTFEPHPASFLHTDKPVALLLTREEKRAVVESLGLTYVEKAFTAAFAALSPEAFFAEVLAPLRCRHLVVGADFRFGRNGAGDVGAAVRIGADDGIAVHTVSYVHEGGERVSSSRIRALVSACKLSEAATLLGRAYSVGGVVVRGARRGRALGYPTLNLVPSPEKLLPPDGVYLTRTVWQGEAYTSVTNVGTNPTFGGQTRVVETHLPDLDHGTDLYGETVTVSFLGFLRGEVKFDTVEALRTAILADVAAARCFFAVNARL